MSKVTEALAKSQAETIAYIERLETQLYRTKAYFEAYALNSDGGSSVSAEIPGFTNTASDIFTEVDRLLGNK